MSGIQQFGFNYGQLAPNDASEVRAASERIKIRMKRTAEDIVAIGQDLIATKQRLGHGQFGEWIQAEFDMSQSSAKRLMDVAERFGGKFANLTNLNSSILYQLAAPSTPDEVVNRTIEARRAGENVTTADVKRWKDEAQRAKAEAEAAKQAKAESDAKIADASARLERAREEYRKLQNRPPERVEIEKVVEKIPAPYVSLDQALESRRNLMEDAEKAARQAKQEEERARREIEQLKTELVRERQAAERARNERSYAEEQNIHLTALRTSIDGFLKNNAEHFMAIDREYLHQSDADYLARVESHLREMANKIAEVRAVSNEYVEFEVVNG